jgi:hypothetical protein
MTGHYCLPVPWIRHFSITACPSALASALMKDWLSRTQIRQRPMLAVYGGLLVLIAIVIGDASLHWLSSGSSDRLAVIGNLLSFGTLLLALVAGIVALAAYSAATGLPNLKLQFRQPRGRVNVPGFIPNGEGQAWENTTVVLTVENSSKYAARVPAVRVEFLNGVIPEKLYTHSREWTPITGNFSPDIMAVQWDGGPNYSIHGNSIRYLPDLDLQGLCSRYGGPIEIIIRLLADGYSRSEITLPVEFTDDPLMITRLNYPPSML